jgi:hypothetical protein
VTDGSVVIALLVIALLLLPEFDIKVAGMEITKRLDKAIEGQKRLESQVQTLSNVVQTSNSNYLIVGGDPARLLSGLEGKLRTLDMPAAEETLDQAEEVRDNSRPKDETDKVTSREGGRTVPTPSDTETARSAPVSELLEVAERIQALQSAARGALPLDLLPGATTGDVRVQRRLTRWAGIFAEEIASVLSVRNRVVHARPTSAEEVDDAVQLGHRILQILDEPPREAVAS